MYNKIIFIICFLSVFNAFVLKNIKAQSLSGTPNYTVSLPKRVDVTNNSGSFEYHVKMENFNDKSSINITFPKEFILFDSHHKSPVSGVLSGDISAMLDSRNNNQINTKTINYYHDCLTAGSWKAVVPVEIKSTIIKFSKITYILDGGSFKNVQPSLYEEGKELLFNEFPVKDGYIFEGWHLKSDFSDQNIIKIDKNMSGDLTLYAKWSKAKALTYEIDHDQFRTNLKEIDNLHQVKRIVFCDDIKPAIYQTIDTIDADGDGGVVAWHEKDASDNKVIFYISTQKQGQKVIAPQDCSNLFWPGNLINYCEEYDLAMLDVSNVVNMHHMFGNDCEELLIDKLIIKGLGTWDTSKVRNMSFMFFNAALDARYVDLGDIGKWNVNNVTDMSHMFTSFANRADINLDFSTWDVSNVLSFSRMFSGVGCLSKNININLSTWNTANCKDYSEMFESFGTDSDSVNIIGYENFDLTNAISLEAMFSHFSNIRATNILDLSKWDAKNVSNIKRMFYGVGVNELLLPKNLSKNASLNDNNSYYQPITSMTWYDLSDNVKAYPMGDLPFESLDSHHLSRMVK